MADFPSILLRLIGILLILLGLSGIALGAFTFTVVYDYNLGAPRGEIKETIIQVSNIQIKLEEDKKEIESAIDNTAKGLKDTAEAAEASGEKLNSPELKEMGDGLNEASENILRLKTGLTDIVTDISRPLKDTTEGLELMISMASAIKAIAYALIIYLIFVHLIIMGIGIALIVIEANLFYYPHEEL